MWSQAVSGANYSGDDQDHWLVPQEGLPVGSAPTKASLESAQLMDPPGSFACYPDHMSMTCSVPHGHDSSFNVEQYNMQQPVSGFHFIVPSQTQHSRATGGSTPTLTGTGSPTVDGASLCTVDHYQGVSSLNLPESAVQPSDRSWYSWSAAGQGMGPAQRHCKTMYQPDSSMPTVQSARQVAHTMPNQPPNQPLESVLPSGPQAVVADSPDLTSVSNPEDEQCKPARADDNWRGDVGPGRKHIYYKMKPSADGLYHCPYRGTDEDPTTKCTHEPTKLKCNYDKYVDSHLKPYRCKQKGCEALRFSSTACRLRHEREAHGSHGHGDKPFRCKFPDCDRSRPDRGFPRQWNRKDHMKRVHDYDEDSGKLGSDAESSVADFTAAPQAEMSAAAMATGQSRKRPHRDSHSPANEPAKVQRRTASPCDIPAQLCDDMSVQWQMRDITEQLRERLLSMAYNLRCPEDVASIRQEINSWDEFAAMRHG